ncbi:MAG: hypothetical protein ABEJ98_05435 [Candidatus Nanohaloarchaea archaeon]
MEMKGFVNTLEAALGTIIVIAMITTVFSGTTPDSDTKFSTESVNQQLDTLQASGELAEIVRERDYERLEQEIDASPSNMNTSIVVHKSLKGRNSSSAFSQSFTSNSNDTAVTLYLWGNGSDVTVELNGGTVYSGNLEFASPDLTSEVVDGSNSLDFSNPAAERVGYMVTRSQRFGPYPPNRSNLQVVSRVVVPEKSVNVSKVYVYLWQ